MGSCDHSHSSTAAKFAHRSPRAQFDYPLRIVAEHPQPDVSAAVTLRNKAPHQRRIFTEKGIKGLVRVTIDGNEMSRFRAKQHAKVSVTCEIILVICAQRLLVGGFLPAGFLAALCPPGDREKHCAAQQVQNF